MPVIEQVDSRERCSYYDDEHLLHREDGPAQIDVWHDGSEWRLNWFVHGERHRENGPAVRTYWDNGKRLYEYYKHGQRHREDGPAYLRIGRTGFIECSVFYKFGKPVYGTELSAEELDALAVQISHEEFDDEGPVDLPD